MANSKGSTKRADIPEDLASDNVIPAADRFRREQSVNDRLEAALGLLSIADRTVIESLFGLPDESPSSYESLADTYGVSREAVIESEAQALRALMGYRRNGNSR